MYCIMLKGKRNLLSIFLTLVVVIFLMPAMPLSAATTSGDWMDNLAPSYDQKDDTAKTISISTAGQLALLAYEVNNGVVLTNYTISITSDIDLSAHYWTPIGNHIYKFKSNIEGNNHLISNMVIDIKTLSPDQHEREIGLVGYMDGSYRTAYIQNLSVSGSIYSETATTDTSSYKYYIGGLVGIADYSTFTNCGTDVAINVIRDSNISTTVGGFIGQLKFDSDETVVNCYSIGNIVFSKTNSSAINPATDSAIYSVGGFVGYFQSDRFGGVANNHSNSDIDVTMLDDGETGSTIFVDVGGFCGHTGRGTYIDTEYYDNCVASGEIDCNVHEIPLTGSGVDTEGNVLYEGGFTGTLVSTAIHDCYYLLDASHSGNTQAYGYFYNGGSGYTEAQLLAKGLTGLTPVQMANDATFDNTNTSSGGSSVYLDGSYTIVDALNAKAATGSTFVLNPTDADVSWLSWADAGDHPVFNTQVIVVTFEAGSNGTMTPATYSETVTSGNCVTSVPTITANSNYTFLGWTNDGGTTTYSSDDILVMGITTNTTFTAIYQQNYTLTFETNGGSEIDSVSELSGTTVDLSGIVPTREGYTFIAWYSDSALTEEVTTVALNSDKTVYAGWEIDIELNREDHMAYIKGYSDGTIQPNANISRAETATLFYRLLTAERRDAIFTSSNSFNDVSADLWYNKAVSSMANGGYFLGYGDGNFKGDDYITRAEFITILSRFIGSSDVTVSFSDVPSTHWAYDCIATAVNEGWIEGYPDGTFKPDQYITRVEAITIINRVLNRGVDEDSTLPAGITELSDVPSSAWYYYEVVEATNSHEYTGSRPSEDWTSLNTIDYSYDIDYYEHP